MQVGHWYWEGALSPETCQGIIDAHFVKKNVIDAVIVNNTASQVLDQDYRKTQIVWVKPGAFVFEVLFKYIQSANHLGEWNFDITGMEDAQIGKYTDGGHYQWHADMDPPCSQGFQRKLSCSIQLTNENDYEGGDLIFQESNGNEYTAPRKQGSIVVFPAYLRHKVTPVTSGTRFSAVGWMRGPAFR